MLVVGVVDLADVVELLLAIDVILDNVAVVDEVRVFGVAVGPVPLVI